ncbi:uncharacterized protein EI97DRAFT_465719 [Westerdykella ornata]|uniref:RING-type E3 ubiquitin transferase n=1 Tax=Westerdykella ornata TaxID=318751 RepID=A0A6A6JPW6_WESOR|nr:uncharacterized protein EI97DRAFT_465719 [Westerdykella ornata]KAF2278417.1 hypothetical protein EI97DRAFT_465719 [Westerdykella ornata]
MSRLRMYIAGSTVLANVVLLRAYYERPNFYSAAVYISQSTGSLMFLINLALIVTASFGYGLQRLFYGRLRAIETEQLYDKAWFAVSETLLAMTIFRDDIGIWFFAMFLCLLAGKVWQWIGEGRVELLEQQPPRNPRLFHTRLMSSLLLSVAFDIFMVNYCIDHILSATRPGVMVMFGFEYVLLAIASMSTLLRYLLSLVEIAIIHKQEKTRQEARRLARQQASQSTDTSEGGREAAEEDDQDEDDGDVPGWEEKGRWVFYLDLTTDFIKSVVYLGFFVILMAFYGIPIHIMRDLFMTIRSFLKRINDFVKYRNATRDMNARYPDATAEELGRENTCIVCREEMRPWVPPGEAQAGQRVDERQRPKKLPCGHILHFSCLRSWLERQQVCPTCRRPVLAEATPNTQTNNQANQGQQNQPNQQNHQNLFGGLGAGQPNAQQPPPGQPGPQGQGAQQNRQHNGQQNGQQNVGAGNFRVLNLGRLRIVLGNYRIPEQRQEHPVANNGNNDQAAALLTQRLAQMHQTQIQPQGQAQTTTPLQLPRDTGTFIPATQALHPADIQSDILRLQQNIIDSVRTLRVQHEQLEIIHSLLAELHRVQQASGVTASNGQELPIIAPLNPQAPIVPQAYFANGPVLRQGDAGLPEGLTLPEGWTLRPMTRAPQVISGSQNMEAPSQNFSVPVPPVATSSAESSVPSTSTGHPPQTETRPSQPPSSSGREQTATGTGTSAEKTTEPASMGSSWSFENIGGGNEASGSSSAVAGGSTESSNLARRTATVEDAEDGHE